MDTRWIQDFMTLAEVQNFTRAADLRNVSQAAFSRRIQALEQWLGAKLIDRATFPTRLTPAGERFRQTAHGLLEQIADVRAELSETPGRNQVRIALTYALASTRLPQWWPRWSQSGQLRCSLQVGNVHDTVSAFSAGAVDILIGYQQALHPIELDVSRFDRHVLGSESVRPYATPAARDAGMELPGREAAPLPLLMYAPNSYFSRVVDAAIERAPQPLHGYRAFEADLSDVLGKLAAQGLGIAWLPDSVFAGGQFGDLVALGDGQWDIEVALVAYRAKASSGNEAVTQLWQRIEATTLGD